MIKFLNGQDSADGIINEYKPDSQERKIITVISSSDNVYQYPELKFLKFEINFRINIIKSAKELNDRDFSFLVFRKSKCNADFWNRNEDGGFELKNDMKPCDAIKDIYVNGSKYGTECSTAMVIVYYKAFLNIFPEEYFNETFAGTILMNWSNINTHLRSISVLKKEPDFLPGDRRYFKNPDVDPKEVEWQGENVIDLGYDDYYGHGIGIYKQEKIISILNKHRRYDAVNSSYLLDEAGRPDFIDLAQKYYKISDHPV